MTHCESREESTFRGGYKKRSELWPNRLSQPFNDTTHSLGFREILKLNRIAIRFISYSVGNNKMKH